MAFDVRNVDMRARIGEVRDVRPVSNLSMIAGRILGLVAAVALPVLGTVVVLQGLGIAARAVDFWMGDPIEPVSLASFVLLDVLVAMFVWCASVMLLSSVLRNRLAVLLGAAVLLALQIWAMTTVPVYFLPAVSVFSSTSAWASDIIVQFADFDRVLQRGAVLVHGETRPWVFSFNPGMQIDDMRVGDELVPFTHDSGLLTVEAGVLAEAAPTAILSLRAQGVPEPDFGYLDSAVDWRRRPATNLIKYLGTQASLFHRNYVALTPAVHWLPSGGANVNREDPSRRPPDFFFVDLAVEVPPGWLVAGPGCQPPGEGLATLHRFRPNLPVQEVALFASDFPWTRSPAT